ncbi:MAG TPA: glycosyltransferase [Verrucomicrobiae bacterium]|nr:glycosyltransferase [Verrucomicrobiae bacterium]
MAMDSLTIIIPTHNRNAVLTRAIEGYFAQSAPKAIHELIVVDDGSTDDTEATVVEMSQLSPFPIRYLRQSNRGPAAARNFGIRETRTDIILFTDSDIVPDCELVAQHLEWHHSNPQDNVAVLGYVSWPSHPVPTPFMKWYGETQLFGYGQLRHKQQLDFGAFYSCNLSLKTNFLRVQGQFDEDFKTAAYEDLELGYRLCNAGLQLLYNRQAVAYHHQFFLFVDACRKLHGNTLAARMFFQKEAGRYFLEQQRKRKARVSYRIAKWSATKVMPILRPAKRMLDSHVRFPSIVYHLFFWYYAIQRMDLEDQRLGHEVMEG